MSQYSYTMETVKSLHHPIHVPASVQYLAPPNNKNKLLRGFPWVDPIVVKRFKYSKWDSPKHGTVLSEVVLGQNTLAEIALLMNLDPNNPELENTPVPYYIIDFGNKEDFDSANDFIMGYNTSQIPPPQGRRIAPDSL